MPIAICAGLTLDEQRRNAAQWAKEWMVLKCKCTSKPCCVFDIDATLCHEGQRIEPIIDLYDWAQQNSITCFMITARSSLGKDYTHTELEKLNITKPRHLFMHPHNFPCSNSADAGRAKLQAREHIKRKGYNVIINCGDAFSDHYVPPEKRDIQKAVGSMQCAVWVDPGDGVAHLKLGHA